MFKRNVEITDKSNWICATLDENKKKFPFVCSEAGEFFALENFFTERDFKDNYWLVYTVDGEGVLEVNDTAIILKSGNIALINCRNYHRYSTNENCDCWHHYWIHIDGVGVDSIFPIISHNQICVLDPTDSDFEDIFKNIMLYAHQKTVYDSLQINLLIHTILNSMANLTISKDNNDSSKYDEMLESAKFLRANYKTNIQIDELAQKYHLSKFYFIRTFKQYLGTTPYDYLLNYRITKAKQLLCKTRWATGRIGLHVGFGSESNFTAQFKRIVGQSPSKYRKENYITIKSN